MEVTAQPLIVHVEPFNASPDVLRAHIDALAPMWLAWWEANRRPTDAGFAFNVERFVLGWRDGSLTLVLVRRGANLVGFAFLVSEASFFCRDSTLKLVALHLHDDEQNSHGEVMRYIAALGRARGFTHFPSAQG